MFEEIWKNIPNYDGLYEVSTFGRVRSVDRYVDRSSKLGGLFKVFKTGSILSPQVINSGYLVVHLYTKQQKRKIGLVHRLVALARIDNPLQYEQVNHKDGDKTHNYFLNLEWLSRLQNVQHGISTGLTDTTVNRMLIKGERYKEGVKEVIEFESQVFAEEHFSGKRTGNISISMKSKESAYGYKWKEIK